MDDMAQAREAMIFNPSSPRSSVGGAESFKGTPDTRLTAFSPDEGSVKSSRLLTTLGEDSPDITPSKLPVNVSYERSMCGADKDPFVTSASATAQQKLSPTASAFQPFASPDDHVSRIALSNLERQRRQVASSPDQAEGYELSQCLNISSPGRALGVSDLHSYLTKLQRLGLLLQEPRQIHYEDGRIVVYFSNIHDAVSVRENLHRAESKLEAKYLSDVNAENDCGARVSIIGTLPTSVFIDRVQFEAALKRLLLFHCQLSGYRTLHSHESDRYEAIAQFVDHSRAKDAVSLFNNKYIERVHVTVSLTGLENTSHLEADSRESERLEGGSDGYQAQMQGLPNAFQTLALPRAPRRVHLSPQNAALQAPNSTYPHLGVQVPPVAMWPIVCQPQFQPGMTQNAARVNRSPYYTAASHHNHVDISRIREGTDVRTTIMLRNIPNKVDQAMLKRIVDESSWGKYDFMYLRIDFANDCNVGYAFINFVDPLDIVDFVGTRGNQRWNCFKSDKVAEISYATIQGKDCLVQKFRNSSVMLEAAHYRPKLFYTSNGPLPELAGEEEPFPHPDNQSKMKRSCENAEHVGLFTPNAGQHFRDEQRRRRSQYDRGTRLAALEEHDLDASLQPYAYR
ncbi:Meiosis protein mei2 [Colletotrichum orbiculare MAFF 240422]|uniref:Meiosis protein mei2 n=1 Tax=Colletotrichum orbiculare (strain 104-T / ATCC 96160 / CBS 514.97 / LARS 414 / MAFF 240422) TaxID=1213857 RepID=A0A484FKE3_COLOR|nr:Meiosis protein mei2 [Colletotrichum orbiculare MAFF 240422]